MKLVKEAGNGGEGPSGHALEMYTRTLRSCWRSVSNEPTAQAQDSTG